MGFNGKRSAVWHRVDGVHREIQNDLLKLSGISLDSAKRLVRPEAKKDICANQPCEHFGHIRDKRVQVQDLRLQNLHAAEGQQLPRERGSAIGSLVDLTTAGVERLVWL